MELLVQVIITRNFDVHFISGATSGSTHWWTNFSDGIKVCACPFFLGPFCCSKNTSFWKCCISLVSLLPAFFRGF